jgi:hypothetical protein
MDDQLLYLRLLHERNGGAVPTGVQKAASDLKTFLEQSISSFLGALSQLIRADMEELKTANQSPLAVETNNSNSSDTASNEYLALARPGHFAYALLDLIQQNIKLLYSETRFKVLVEIALQVAKGSPRSFLRCKAFELLISIGKVEGVGLQKVEREVEQTLKGDKSRWVGSFKKIAEQWRGMKVRAGEKDKFRAQLSFITVDYPLHQKVSVSFPSS